MSKSKRRAQAARRAANVNAMPAVRKLLAKCRNCGEPGPHFVPPSLGEPGFYMCAGRKQGLTVHDVRRDAGGILSTMSLPDALISQMRQPSVTIPEPQRPWSDVSHDIAADLRNAGLNALARDFRGRAG